MTIFSKNLAYALLVGQARHHSLSLAKHSSVTARLDRHVVVLSASIHNPQDDEQEEDEPIDGFHLLNGKRPTSLEAWKEKYGDPMNPPSMPRRPPNKADLYSNDELEKIFNLHNELSESFPPVDDSPEAPLYFNLVEGDETDAGGMGGLGGIHDMVLQALQDDANKDTPAAPPKMTEQSTPDAAPFQDLLTPDFVNRLRGIRAIASDVDGTLLGANHRLHPRTEQALHHVLDAVENPDDSTLEYFFLATGKTRPGALHNLSPALQKRLEHYPGVYTQGLYCLGPKRSHGQAEVIFERHLPDDAVRATEELAAAHNLTLLGYDGDALYATATSDPENVHLAHAKYGEPVPILLETFVGRQWHKLILMGHDDAEMKATYRPQLDALAAKYDCGTTQAVELMLEVLPRDCHKGTGVGHLCRALGIDPGTELLAMGDGENDKELLEMAAIGIAMGNGVSVTKQVASVVMDETSSEGAAGLALEQFGLRRVLGDEE